MRRKAYMPRYSCRLVHFAQLSNRLLLTSLPTHIYGGNGQASYESRIAGADASAQVLGDKPQHVYSVRFAARELWGDQASARDCVYVAMWDDYLEPA
jgi:hypothetical protein